MATTGTLQESLHEVAKADLQIILDEIPPKAKGARLAKPFYIVDEFEQFHGDTALVYQGRATLAFFYLDPSLGLCQIRKYRYKRSARSWDRYLVELKYIPSRYLDSSGALIRPD